MRKKKIGTFVDVFTPMLDKEGKPRSELFIGDHLHMNKQGYDIWQQALDPYLK
jgi:lysophospholipase L1-like esterase